MSIIARFLVKPRRNVERCGISVITGDRRRTGASFSRACGMVNQGDVLGSVFCQAGRGVADGGASSVLGFHASGKRAGSNLQSNTMIFSRVRRFRDGGSIQIRVSKLNGGGGPHRFCVNASNCMQSNFLSGRGRGTVGILDNRTQPGTLFPFVYGLSSRGRISRVRD